MRFRLYPLRFTFRARQPIRFPAGQSANILRGAFGTILSRLPGVPAAAYARIFEPRAPADSAGPSGLENWPRPFVFRASHLDGCTLPEESTFHFNLNFFDLRHPEALSYLATAFAQMAEVGFGPGRGRAELIRVEQVNQAGDASALSDAPEPLVLKLDPAAQPVRRVTIGFRTPTELKSGATPADRPEFAILAARIRDRLSTLRACYDEGPLAIDFRAFGERAQRIVMTRCDLTYREGKRRSSRTGQTHPLGGFTGEADYEGSLTEFLPYLQAARWTGVGRQTVWGKGEIAILTASSG